MHLDKAKIKHSFAAASVTYDGAAELQRTVGRGLLAIIGQPMRGGRFLDLGCGTGFLTAGLLGERHRLQVIVAIDIALPMLQVTQRKLADRRDVLYMCADAEQLPFVEQCIDGVFSNLALQWCVNLGAVFTDIKRVLKPAGRLVFSTFGPQTLQELKAAWAETDCHRHVNDFYSKEQLTQFLHLAGYTEIMVESKLYMSGYGSVLELMRELKQLGAHNVIAGRNKNMTTRTSLQRMIAAYERDRTGNLLPATFEVIMVSAS